MRALRVGCSGWSCESWRGRLHPPGRRGVYVRCHYGHRGNYSTAELVSW